MKFTILGSGTSSGVPTIGCVCATCLSEDWRDKRLRTSLLIESDSTRVLIDASPDFRQQMLRYSVRSLDAVVFTHHHFDHIAGFDDIRAFNFVSQKPMPIFTMQETYQNLRRIFQYAFEKPAQVGGGVPSVEVNFFDNTPFMVGNITFIPIFSLHGSLRVSGFRIGNFAYCTDTNFIPDESIAQLQGLDILVLDALRYHTHPTHFTVNEAIDVARKIGAKHTFFTHIAHEIKHAELEKNLPEGFSIAFDGLEITIA